MVGYEALVRGPADRSLHNPLVLFSAAERCERLAELDLLRRITDLQVRAARHANPLTLLPGNVPVYECIDHLLRRQTQFAVTCCDIDHFKLFNDVYGYGRGDKVIKRLAELATLNCDRERDLVGHIGGDDFVLVLGSDDWRGRCERPLTALNAAAAEFYSDEERAACGVWNEDRHGPDGEFAAAAPWPGAMAVARRLDTRPC